MFPQSRQAIYYALTSTPQVWFKKLSLVIMVAPHPSLFEDSAAGMKNNSTALSHRPNFKDIELPENDSAFCMTKVSHSLRQESLLCATCLLLT